MKKISIFLMLMALFAPLAMMSQETSLTVYGDGTTTTSGYVPIYGTWADNYTKAEFVMPADDGTYDLSPMADGTITKMKFYVASIGTYGTGWDGNTFQVFMKEIDDTTISDFQGTEGATIVYEDGFDTPTGACEFEIEFTTPYIYHGGNLLVGIYDLTGSGTSFRSVYFIGNSVPNAAGCGYHESSLGSVSFSSQSFIPKTTFTYIPSPNYCAPPTNLHIVGEIGTRSVTMGWDAEAGDMFEYALVSGHGIDPTAVTTFDGTTTTNEMTWNNLTPDSDYTVLLRKVCNIDNYSKTSSLELHTAVACVRPTELATGIPTTNSATLSWTGFSDSYIVMMGEPNTPGTIVNADFETGDLSQANFTSTADYPFTVVANTHNGTYCAKSSNNGQQNSTADMVLEVNMVTTGSISFSAMVSSETYWDKAFFSIDDNEIIGPISGYGSWIDYGPYELAVGNHTLRWYYTKDYSGNYGEDSFFVDDIMITGLVPSTWNSYTTNNTTITFNDLNYETPYMVKVQGDCGDEGYSKESNMIGFITLPRCPVPFDLVVDPSSLTAHEATLTWTADNDRYNIRLSEVDYIVNASFETGDFSQADFINDDNYPWTVVAKNYSGAFCAISASGNHNQTSALELQVTLPTDLTLTFSAKVSSENNYDLAYFSIDNTVKINGISGNGNWIDYEYPLTAGTHTLRWYYTKDSNASRYDDCFYVDDIQIVDGAHIVGNYNSNTTTYDFNGLDGGTTYIVNVRGICDNETTNWSADYNFITPVACPAAPTNLVAGTPGATSVTLSWTYPVEADVWQIYLNGNDEVSLIVIENDLVTDSTYTLTGLTPGTDYTAKIRAYCSSFEQSDWSNEVSFRTLSYLTKPITGYNHGGGWNLIASPLPDTITPTETNGFLVNSYDLYRFNQSAAPYEWENWKTEGSDHFHFDLVNGRGYLYANSEGTTLTFIGTPLTETEKTMELDYFEGTENCGWNLVGNPFAVAAYLANNKEFYTLETNTVNPMPSVPGDAIEPMEGIFVVAENPNETITFTTTNPNRSQNLVINLSDGSNLIDRAIVCFNEGGSLPKVQFFENSTKIYIPQEGKDYAVARCESIGEQPISFKAEENSTFTLSFTSREVEFSYLHLLDNLTGDDVDLLQTPSYTFNAQTTNNVNRFKLVFDLGTTGVGENFAFFSDGNFIISNEGEATLEVVDVTGRILSSETVNGHVSKTINAASGIYMLRLINGDSVKVQKVVVR